MPSVDPVAAYGAVLATAVALWSAWDAWSNRRPRLRVSGSIGTVYVPTGIARPDYRPAGRYVTFKAENVGSVGVRVQSCGLARTKWRRGRRIVTERLQLSIPHNVQFPQDVAPGHSFDAVAELLTFCGSMRPGGWAGYDRPYFTSAIGKTYLGKLDVGFLDELESVSTEPQQAVE